MALGSTQPLTEMSTGIISWGGKGGWFVGLTTIPLSYAYCVEIWEPLTSVNPQDLSMPEEGFFFTFYVLSCCTNMRNL